MSLKRNFWEAQPPRFGSGNITSAAYNSVPVALAASSAHFLPCFTETKNLPKKNHAGDEAGLSKQLPLPALSSIYYRH